ncbi:MAG TPA: RDD family protein [Acidimicrobiales bacterium]
MTAYQYPSAASPYPAAPATDPTAVMARRSFAFIIDVLLFTLVASFFGPTPLSPFALYEKVPSNFDYNEACDQITQNSNDVAACLQIGDRVYYTDGADAAVASLVTIAYFLLILGVLQGLKGVTPGKALLGVRTVDEQGRGPGIGKALARSVLWIVDGIPCFFPLVGLITGFSTKGHRRVGDMAAKTFVIGKADVGRPVIVPGLTTAYSAGYGMPGAYGAGAPGGYPPPGMPGQPGQPGPPGPSPWDRPAPPPGAGVGTDPGAGPWGGPAAGAGAAGAGAAGAGAAGQQPWSAPAPGASPWAPPATTAGSPQAPGQSSTPSGGWPTPGGPSTPGAPTTPSGESPTTTPSSPTTPGAPGGLWGESPATTPSGPSTPGSPSTPSGESPTATPSSPTTPSGTPTTPSGESPAATPSDAPGAAIPLGAAGSTSPAANGGTGPAAQQHQAAGSGYEPQWDAARNTYIVWEPNRRQWLGWDDSAKEWRPL